MKTMINIAKTIIAKFARDEDGASAIEYAILAAVIGGGLFTAAGLLSTGIGGAFDDIITYIS